MNNQPWEVYKIIEKVKPTMQIYKYRPFKKHKITILICMTIALLLFVCSFFVD